MTTLLTKLLSGIGIVSVIWVFGFFSGYKVKANAINSATAKQDIKLATLQSKYDNSSNIVQLDYLTAFQGIINESNPTINNNGNHHDQLWYFFNSKRIAGAVAKNKPTKCSNAETTTRLENAKKNYLQLIYLQQYIIDIQKLQNE